MFIIQDKSRRYLSRSLNTPHVALILAFFAILLAPRDAGAYSTSRAAQPTDLRVSIVLSEVPSANNWTRYVTFKNLAGLAGDEKSVAVGLQQVKPPPLRGFRDHRRSGPAANAGR